LDDPASYRHWVGEILQKFSTIREPGDAVMLAQDCLILPPPPANFETITKMADTALAGTSDRSMRMHCQLVKGLIEYRQGHFDEAKKWLLKVSAEPPDAMDNWNRAVQVQMVLAMTHYKLKEFDEAHATLANGLRMAEKNMARSDRDLKDTWASWVQAHFLMREAVALMPEAASSPAAAVVETEPGWLKTLRQSGLQFTSERQDDGTWEVSIEDQPFSDLSPLHGLPISRLSVMHTTVSDLSPLRGMSLRWLRLGGTKVSDISPLQGMPIETLQLSGTPVADISPLRGMPLRRLNMTDCQSITNLEPISNITSFQSVILPPHATNIEFFRASKDLSRISFQYDPATKGPAQSAEEFWKAWDQHTKL
jgi:hypothetical protein